MKSPLIYFCVFYCFKRHNCSFWHFLSKIGHLLWKDGTLCCIESIVYRIVFLAFGTNASNSASMYTFSLLLRFLSSMSNSPFLNIRNHSRQLSLKAASPYVSYKQSIRLSCRFLQIEEVNQKFQQMTLIRLKTRHFRTQKTIIFRNYPSKAFYVFF